MINSFRLFLFVLSSCEQNGLKYYRKLIQIEVNQIIDIDIADQNYILFYLNFMIDFQFLFHTYS